jgi:hypothetical protein
VDCTGSEFLPPAVPVPSGEDSGEKSSAEESVAGKDATDTTMDVSTDESTDESPAAESGQSAEEEASTINARHDGWQYRIPDYKGNLLARRWNDILKAEDEE